MDTIDAVRMGKRIKNLRKARGMTQQKLAEKVDISTHYISEIERGSKSVSVEILSYLARVLDVSTDYLIFGQTSGRGRNMDALDELLEDLSPDRRESLFEILRVMVPFIR